MSNLLQKAKLSSLTVTLPFPSEGGVGLAPSLTKIRLRFAIDFMEAMEAQNSTSRDQVSLQLC